MSTSLVRDPRCEPEQEERTLVPPSAQASERLPPASRLRILPVRRCEPAYDDELEDSGVLPGAAAGALTLSLSFGPTPARQARLQLVRPSAAGQPAVDLPVGPPPRAWVGRLVQAVTEVLSGSRPLAQLAPHIAPTVYAGLDRALEERRSSGALEPHGGLPAVRSVHVSQPRAGIAEVAAVVRKGGPRMGAMALRLEHRDARWQCVTLQIG